MNVLSLFDGMSCGQIALNQLGIKYDKYFACEIDKYAIQVTQANYPDTIQLGDVTKVKGFDLPKIDLLIGGSPCQGFSFAGKQLAFDDPRSKLFFEYVRLLKECNPKYFLLENVRMKKEYEKVMSDYLGIEPIQINSSLVSAQNRVRLYWTNIYNKPFGLFGKIKCMIPQPEDKGILLKDILETEVNEKYYLSDNMLNYFSNRSANFNQGKINIRNENGKSSCLTSSMASCGISDNFIQVNSNVSKQNNEIFLMKKNYIQWDSSGKGHNSQHDRAFYQNGKHGCLTQDGHTGVLFHKKIRRLTPLECERLQTVPDQYTNHVSDTQRYRMLGNGWTVDVIKHILGYMDETGWK